MNPQNVTVVPTIESEHRPELLADCEMVARLMRKLMEEHSELTVQEAFALIKQRLMRVCILEWDSMEPKLIQE